MAAQVTFKMNAERHTQLRALLQFQGGLITLEEVAAIMRTVGWSDFQVSLDELPKRLTLLSASMAKEIS